MAKLKAYNRQELTRLYKEKHTPEGDLCIYEKITIALMSDCTVLKKVQVTFKPDTYNPKGRKHSYGWKRAGKFELGVEAFEKRYLETGFIKE